MLRRTASVAAALLLLLGAGLTGREAAPSLPDDKARALQAALDQWAAQPGHVGVSAAVVLADQSLWSGAAGIENTRQAMTTDHLIQIASITKTMTAAIVLQLVDERVLRLDDPISRWLPDAPESIPPRITIRQLMNHTSGVANYTGTRALGEAIAAEATHVFTPAELLGFVGPPRFAPGESTEYTNTAFLLLSLIAERATGRPIVDLYRQRVWSPLELTAVFMPAVEDPPGPIAHARATTALLDPLEYPAILSIGQGAFGLMATATTVARYGHALFAGTVLSSDMQEAMRTLVPAAGNIPGETGAGLGIRSYHYLDRTQFGHSGGATFGSSLLLFDPESGVTVAVVMNQGSGADHFVLAPQLLAIAAR